MSSGEFDRIEASPDPSPEELEAILRAVGAVLDAEAKRARPAAWTLGGWPARRAGVTDFRRWLDGASAWRLSARLPWGGRAHSGLHGRGDAK